MTSIVISSKAGFESASAFAESIGAKYENPFETGNRDFRKYDVIFKYGFSRPIKYKKESKVFNKTEPTEIALDKIKTFESLKEFNITVPYTTSIKEANKWFKEDKYVIARTVSNGHNSEGVVFCQDAEDLLNADAKFYTKFVRSTNEFRINVWRNKVISVYDKVEKEGEFNFKLFKGQNEHPQLVDLVQKVYSKIPLDFYGIDVLRDKKGNLTILEINSAPVLYPYTLNKLSEIVKEEV